MNGVSDCPVMDIATYHLSSEFSGACKHEVDILLYGRAVRGKCIFSFQEHHLLGENNKEHVSDPNSP